MRNIINLIALISGCALGAAVGLGRVSTNVAFDVAWVLGVVYGMTSRRAGR